MTWISDLVGALGDADSGQRLDDVVQEVRIEQIPVYFDPIASNILKTGSTVEKRCIKSMSGLAEGEKVRSMVALIPVE